MGQTVSAIKEKAKAKTVEDEKLANDALDSLVALSKTKRDLFYAKIESETATPLLIPIEKVVTSKQRIFCSASSEAEGLKTAIEDVLGGFASGNFMKGLTSSLGVAVDSVLGSYSGNDSELIDYTIVADALGGVARIDYYLYSYQFQSKGLIDLAKNVLVVCVVISSAKIANLTKNTVHTIVANKYNTDDDTERELAKVLLKEIMNNIDAANGRNPIPLVRAARLPAAAMTTRALPSPAGAGGADVDGEGGDDGREEMLPEVTQPTNYVARAADVHFANL